MGRVGLPFVAFAAQINGNVFLGYQQHIVGRMRRMAGDTVALFNRFTQAFIFGIFFRPLLQFNSVGMALPADFYLGVIEQFFAFRSVGIMAVQASGFIGHRPVHATLAESFIDHILVAVATQPRALLFGLKGIGGTGTRVALGTFFFGNRCMHIIIENAPFVGTVGAVAGVAVAVVDLVIQVAFSKGRAIGFMAFGAQGGHLIFQQVIRPGRGVRIVAVQTALVLLQRFMLVLRVLSHGTDVLVAFDTQCIAGFFENEPVIRPVGIMTGLAVAFNDHLVSAARLIRYDLLMATAAKCIDVGNQQIFMVGRMGVMTGRALSFSKQWVHGSLLDRFLQFLMTFQTLGALSTGLKLNFMLRIRRCSQDKR